MTAATQPTAAERLALADVERAREALSRITVERLSPLQRARIADAHAALRLAAESLGGGK